MVVTSETVYVEGTTSPATTTFTSVFTAAYPGYASACEFKGWVDGSNADNVLLAVVIIREGQLNPGNLATPGLGTGAQPFYNIPDNLWVSSIGRVITGHGATWETTGRNTGWELSVGDSIYVCWTGDGLSDVGCTVSFSFTS